MSDERHDPLLMPAGVTSLIPLPRDENTMVICEQLDAVVLYRNGSFQLADVLGRLPRGITKSERQARRYAAWRWPQARWVSTAMRRAAILAMQENAKRKCSNQGMPA